MCIRDRYCGTGVQNSQKFQAGTKSALPVPRVLWHGTYRAYRSSGYGYECLRRAGPRLVSTSHLPRPSLFSFHRAVRSSYVHNEKEAKPLSSSSQNHCLTWAARNLFAFFVTKSLEILAANNIPPGSFQCSLEEVKVHPQLPVVLQSSSGLQ